MEMPEWDESRHFYESMYGSLTPLGFSPDGKFAYMYEPSDEAGDFYLAEFVIVDLKNDSICELMRNGNGMGFSCWDTMMTYMQPVFEKLMRKSGIVMERVPRQEFPIPSPSGEITIRVEKSVLPSDDHDPDFRFYKAAEVFLVNGLGEEKMLMRREFGEYSSIVSFEACCYLKSPFEDRAAVILMESQRGWEGPPNPHDLTVVGAHLTAGFAKRANTPH